MQELMTVAVMRVRIMHMSMAHWLVAVRMCVRFGDRSVVPVLVVLVMDMAVFMVQCFVLMIMDVTLRQMDPQPKSHQKAGQDEFCGQRLIEKHHGQQRTDERGEREISAGSGGAEMAQRQNEQNKTDADGEETE